MWIGLFWLWFHIVFHFLTNIRDWFQNRQYSTTRRSDDLWFVIRETDHAYVCVLETPTAAVWVLETLRPAFWVLDTPTAAFWVFDTPTAAFCFVKNCTVNNKSIRKPRCNPSYFKGRRRFCNYVVFTNIYPGHDGARPSPAAHHDPHRGHGLEALRSRGRRPNWQDGRPRWSTQVQKTNILNLMFFTNKINEHLLIS